MFDSMAEATRLLEEVLAELDPACLSAADAVAGLDAFARAERLCAAGRVLCAGRATETRAHERDGARSPAEWLARRTGQSVGEAIGALVTARQAPTSGALDTALRAGELSGAQATAVAEAVAADPGAAAELLQTARQEPLKVLREKARTARAAGSAEAELVASEEQLHPRRYLRTFSGHDGAVRGEFTLAPLAGARLLAALEVEQRAAFAAAFLKLVLTDGVDVRSVAHAGRVIPAYLRSALEARDPVCVVPGCGESRLLEIDHWRIPFCAGGPTSLDNLCRVCRAHHRMKTHRGFVLDGGPGRWRWRPPRVFAPFVPPVSGGPPAARELVRAIDVPFGSSVVSTI